MKRRKRTQKWGILTAKYAKDAKRRKKRRGILTADERR
jgi:hypothetical protein